MRPWCSTVPVILPPGHHMSVAGAPVVSTTPLHTHMSERTSTLVRRIVRTVASLKATEMLGALVGSSAPVSLVNAYSTTGAAGAVRMSTPMVAGEARALSTIDFCWSFIFVSGGALRNIWFQVAPIALMITPRRAAALLTASTLVFGTVHTSVLVSGRI